MQEVGEGRGASSWRESREVFSTKLSNATFVFCILFILSASVTGYKPSWFSENWNIRSVVLASYNAGTVCVRSKVWCSGRAKFVPKLVCWVIFSDSVQSLEVGGLLPKCLRKHVKPLLSCVKSALLFADTLVHYIISYVLYWSLRLVATSTQCVFMCTCTYLAHICIDGAKQSSPRLHKCPIPSI